MLKVPFVHTGVFFYYAFTVYTIILTGFVARIPNVNNDTFALIRLNLISIFSFDCLCDFLPLVSVDILSNECIDHFVTPCCRV